LLAEQIRSGEIQPDYPIPSEATLQQQYGVARNTSRRAVELLRERGLVYTISGRGSFVKARPR
jgi:DNA-binding GntR family transcriptional regulator